MAVYTDGVQEAQMADKPGKVSCGSCGLTGEDVQPNPKQLARTHDKVVHGGQLTADPK